MRAILDLVLPPRCASCNALGASPLCSDCDLLVRWIGDLSCGCCGAPTPRPRPTCALCARHVFAFDRAASAAVYDGPMRDAIKAFKLAGERRAANNLSSHLVHAAARLGKPDVITWVPSSRKTESQRGFDPAFELTRAFADRIGVKPRRLLDKVRDTIDQHGLGRGARSDNLRGAFAARASRARVLLVDDILTTGATANACADALKTTGATRVEVLTVARTLRPGIS